MEFDCDSAKTAAAADDDAVAAAVPFESFFSSNKSALIKDATVGLRKKVNLYGLGFVFSVLVVVETTDLTVDASADCIDGFGTTTTSATFFFDCARFDWIGRAVIGRKKVNLAGLGLAFSIFGVVVETTDLTVVVESIDLTVVVGVESAASSLTLPLFGTVSWL